VPRTPLRESWQHRFLEANGLRFHLMTERPPEGAAPRGLVLLLGVNALLTGLLGAR
jgi:hypothetical protein